MPTSYKLSRSWKKYLPKINFHDNDNTLLYKNIQALRVVKMPLGKKSYMNEDKKLIKYKCDIIYKLYIIYII